MHKRGGNPFDDDDEGGFGATSSNRGYGDDHGGSRGGTGGYGGSRAGVGSYGDGYGDTRGGGYGGDDYGSRGYERGGHDDRMLMSNQRMESSSANSLRVLNETMRLGVDTTEELERQAESLDRTERRLDEMHVELDKGERNMRRIKSSFGGIGNYFARKKSIEEVTNPKALRTQSKGSSSAKSKPANKKQQKQQQQEPAQGTGNAVVDQNLDEMSKALHQLRGIGEVIGTQLDDSEQQIDRVKYKVDRDHVKMDKLNKDIKKELYK